MSHNQKMLKHLLSLSYINPHNPQAGIYDNKNAYRPANTRGFVGRALYRSRMGMSLMPAGK